ncbi:hypothetical protein EU803_07930 [Loktanella sp. IMCC34160]|uniref:hypothetical protein n=1 Tax=Loktanella sp. IMCC34160 TaxID=2510646 RepID=UPI00101D37D1|nr:hypothetical protein [Loktanella sp. IMCC34160]RYG92349.1 hypothetical protein EU803_07930 [Loktanella sp. IMCC34160]
MTKAVRAVDVILHLGAHRTGTTTLQMFLQANEHRLATNRIRLWTPRRTRSGLFAGLMDPPDKLPLMQNRGRVRAAGLVALECTRLAERGAATLLVSEENLIGNPRDNLRRNSLYPDLRGRLEGIALPLGRRCTRIGLSIRSYDTYWASALAFAVARGHALPTAARLDRLVTQPRRWSDIIRGVAKVFPNAEIMVWPFERFAGRPADELAMLLGGVAPGAPVWPANDWHNPSPRLDALRQAIAVRGEDPETALPPGDGRWMPFDASQQATLRGKYREDLQWLRAGADGLARLVETAPTQPFAAPAAPDLTETKHKMRTAAAGETSRARTGTGGLETWAPRIVGPSAPAPS